MKPEQRRFSLGCLYVGHPGRVASPIVQGALAERAAAPDTDPPAALSRARHPVDSLNTLRPPPGRLDGSLLLTQVALGSLTFGQS